MNCGVPHPELSGLSCRLEEGEHPEHLGGYGADVVTWPNAHYRPISGRGPVVQRKKVLMDMAHRVRGAQGSP